MKILYLSYCVGNTSSGICSYKKILGLLANGCEMYVLTSSSSVDTIESEGNFKYLRISSFINRPSLIFDRVGNIIRKDITYYFWKKRIKSKVDEIFKNWKPDIVYADSFPPPTFEIAYYINEKYNIPYMLHFTDPIPAPVTWKPQIGYRSKMYKEIERPVRNAKKISFGNEAMLKYEQSLFKYNIREKSFISPDPHSATLLNLPILKKSKSRFIFFGSFYGNRNPKLLFNAFDKLIESNPDVELLIYDSKNNVFNKKEYSKNIGNSILFVGRTNDSLSAFTNADYLIDMDGFSKAGEEVYLSNKLKDYLRINRPILAITSENSPSEKLLKGLKNVLIARHSSEDIYQSLLMLIDGTYADYTDRLEVVKKFDIDNIVQNIIKELE